MRIDELKEDLEAQVPALAELKGTVLIIPIDAPVPREIEDTVASGSTLLKRMAAFDETPESFVLVPLAGQEMYDIASAFFAMVTVKRIALLEDLPGARYDALMMQGVRRAGIRTIQWPAIAEMVEQQRRLEQRTLDKRPWTREPTAPPEEKKLPPAEEYDDDGVI